MMLIFVSVSLGCCNKVPLWVTKDHMYLKWTYKVYINSGNSSLYLVLKSLLFVLLLFINTFLIGDVLSPCLFTCINFFIEVIPLPLYSVENLVFALHI